MRIFGRRMILLGLVGLAHFLLAGTALAQSPRINYLMPMGGKAGATFDLAITGQDIQNVTGLHFDFPGADVEVLDLTPLKPVANPNPGKGKQKQPQGRPQYTQRFKVTLPADAPLGIHDVRIITSTGASNPRAFVVGEFKEFVEEEPNDDVPNAQKIDINSTVNGAITNKTDVDYYSFIGKKGQHVVVSCLTTTIDSVLPAEIGFYGMSGVFLGTNKSYLNNDALLDAVLPEDGEYYVRVASFAYNTAGLDHFYRLTVSTAPWIDAVFPPSVEPGKTARVTVYGRNLPGGVADPASVYEGRVLEKVVMNVTAPKKRDPRAFRGYLAPPTSVLDPFPLTLKNGSGSSNTFMMTLATAPVVLDNGANEAPSKAQKVSTPCEVAGQLERRNARDWYSFTAKKGQVLAIDAFGDRLGSNVDLYYALYNEKGDVLHQADDMTDNISNQFYNGTDDPATYVFKVPEDGEYKLMISSKFAYSHSGPRYYYGLRIAEEAADFSLVAMPVSPIYPEAVVLNQASHQAYTVFAIRHGDFTGDIFLSGDNLPPGVTIPPQVIMSGQKSANLIMSAADDAPMYTGNISVVGTAVVNGKKVVRPVRAATVTWPLAPNQQQVLQQQAAQGPTFTRLDRELTLAVRGTAPYVLIAKTDSISVPEGDSITIDVTLKRNADFKDAVNIMAINLPPGLVQQPLRLSVGADTGKLVLDFRGGTIPAGTKLTLAARQTAPIGNPAGKKGQPRGPAIPAETSNFTQTCNPILVTITPKAAEPEKTDPPGQVSLQLCDDRLIDVAAWLRPEITVSAR